MKIPLAITLASLALYASAAPPSRHLAVEPAVLSPQSPIPSLLEQLDAPRLAERQAAEAALIELGPDILDRLPHPETIESAEVRLRLRRVRERLNELAAEQAYRSPEFDVADVTVRQAASGGVARIELRVTWEPPVHIITLRQAMADVQAVDRRGRTITVSDPDAERTVILDDPRQQATVPIVLKLPPGSDLESFGIARLRGRMSATYLGPVRAFRFVNPAGAPARKTSGEATVTLERFTDPHPSPLPEGEGTAMICEARVRVTFANPGDALASYRGWIFQNRAVLQLPDGKPIEPVATETYLQTPQAVGVAYRFDVERVPEQAALIYRTPTAITTRPVPYDLAIGEEGSEKGEGGKTENANGTTKGAKITK